ncbi:trypsin-like serine peptidase [Gemmobacter denitrificans]|uniref:Serine protease n=1 Tax=Gemmobacter denitrificans TaxID=3123040 RepID=A0ABU8BU76_9RHOB
MKRLSLALALILAALPLRADDARLRSLMTGDDSRGWDAVGRLNLGRKGFCTGALIAPDLVLTAGHCLFDKDTGARIDPTTIEFLAGWRNGRAAAYRGVSAAVAHPDYVYAGGERLDRVTHDLALLRLDRPIHLPSIQPFDIADQPGTGDSVGVVSYARDRADAPSLQEVCEVLNQRPEMLVLSCDVDFGASGSPVFSLAGGVPRVVSVVSAKAELGGRNVALGTALRAPLQDLQAEMALSSPRRTGKVRVLSGGGAGTFIKP